MTGFDLHPDALRSHAKHLAGVAEMVDDAAAAARGVAANDGAFGMLVGPMLVGWVNEVEVGAVEAVREASASVRATAQGLRDMAAVYELVDDLVADALHRVGGRRD